MKDDFEKNLTRVLESFDSLQLAILFGSHAHGMAGFDSDIDLAVLMDETITRSGKTKLIDSLVEVSGCPVDIVDIRTIGEPLLGQVLRGKRLVGSSDALARLITRHLVDTADFVPLQQRILKRRRDSWIH